MFAWLTDALGSGAEIVTASRRLTRALRSANDRQQMAGGAHAWQSPRVSTLGDWVRNQLDAAGFVQSLPIVLEDHASLLLWEQCLRKHIADELLNFSGLARQAQEAWRRLQEWQVPPDRLFDYPRSHDEQLFALAARSYQRILAEHDWTDTSARTALLLDIVRANRVSLPESMVHVGFDRTSPAVQALFELVADRGCELSPAPGRPVASSVRLATFTDTAAELRAAGNWARETLYADPDRRLAIIYPGLETEAERIPRLVREGLAPGWQYGNEGYRSAVNVSYGRRLADYPAVAVALLLLRWLSTSLSTRDISLLLRSRMLGHPDTAGRSRLELLLRRLPDRDWSASSLLAALRNRDDSTDSVAFIAAIEHLVALRRAMPSIAGPADWAQQIDRALTTVVWPGSDAPGSDEYQLINRWRTLLNDFAKLELVEPKMTFSDAVRRVAAMSAESLFQPQSSGSLVDLLGVLESAGMEYDAIWIGGLDASRWPPAGNPSFLLPRALQREHGMPDADADNTFEYANSTFNNMLRAGDEVVLSRARMEGETELPASPMLADYMSCDSTAVSDPGWHAFTLQHRDSILVVENEVPPAVRAAETIAGGAYTVQRQLTEPFAAFAYGRLRVNDLAIIEAGLPASMRGSMLHDALHALYVELPSAAELRQWQDGDLDRRVADAVDHAVRGRHRHADSKQRRLLQLESARLCNLLRDFVGEDSERGEFSVHAVEQKIVLERFGMHIDLRADRVDRLADNSLAVLDYKSGQPLRLLNRQGDPSDYQLVVYAAAIDERVSALALINIDSRKIGISGVGGPFEHGRDAQDAWHARLSGWQASVDAALREIADGDVRVNLEKSPMDSRPLAILNRIEELRREV